VKTFFVCIKSLRKGSYRLSFMRLLLTPQRPAQAVRRPLGRRKWRAVRIQASAIPEGLVRNVQLVSEMFTAAVFMSSGLNYLYYRRLRIDAEDPKRKNKNLAKDQDATKRETRR
jgi:hypothetical protein